MSRASGNAARAKRLINNRLEEKENEERKRRVAEAKERIEQYEAGLITYDELDFVLATGRFKFFNK